MKETHNEFIERVIEESREPTLAEKTKDALSDGFSKTNEVENV